MRPDPVADDPVVAVATRRPAVIPVAVPPGRAAVVVARPGAVARRAGPRSAGREAASPRTAGRRIRPGAGHRCLGPPPPKPPRPPMPVPPGTRPPGPIGRSSRRPERAPTLARPVAVVAGASRSPRSASAEGRAVFAWGVAVAEASSRPKAGGLRLGRRRGGAASGRPGRRRGRRLGPSARRRRSQSRSPRRSRTAPDRRRGRGAAVAACPVDFGGGLPPPFPLLSARGRTLPSPHRPVRAILHYHAQIAQAVSNVVRQGPLFCLPKLLAHAQQQVDERPGVLATVSRALRHVKL